MSKKEASIYGRRACLAVAKKRPQHILRAFYSHHGPTKDLSELLKVCAHHRKPYRAVSEEELEKLSGSKHHEGVVIFTERRERSYLGDAIERAVERLDEPNVTPAVSTWLALDDVANDHNLGAIARSLAWFGGAGLVWEAPRPQLSGAALRVAQGGAEEIELVAVPNLVDALEELKRKGVRVLGADQGARKSAFEIGNVGPICWVLGNEQHGLSKEVSACCDELVSVPGSGLVESMNVSVTAGILIAQSFQTPSFQTPSKTAQKPKGPPMTVKPKAHDSLERVPRQAKKMDRSAQISESQTYEIVDVRSISKRTRKDREK